MAEPANIVIDGHVIATVDRIVADVMIALAKRGAVGEIRSTTMTTKTVFDPSPHPQALGVRGVKYEIPLDLSFFVPTDPGR